MNESLKITGAAVLGVGLGFVIGLKVTEKRLGDQYDKLLEQETAGMKEFYSTVKKPYRTPVEAVADLIPLPEAEPDDPRQKAMKIAYHKVVKGEGYVAATEDEFEGAKAAEEAEQDCEIDPPIARNIFEEARSPENPYIITQEEFMLNEPGFEQGTLTYYERGGILADTQDSIIENSSLIVGSSFSDNFGKDSSDPNVVHVRNEKLSMDFEILKSEKSYEEDVLGQTEQPETPRERIRRGEG